VRGIKRASDSTIGAFVAAMEDVLAVYTGGAARFHRDRHARLGNELF
jgi:hypothetical protein